MSKQINCFHIKAADAARGLVKGLGGVAEVKPPNKASFKLSETHTYMYF